MDREQGKQDTSGSIEEQFNLIAEEYDINRKKFIPCFEDYYKNTTKFIVSNITQPKRILDLGAGTGLLSYFWYKYFPASEYVLVDIADDMLQVARKRFAGIDTVSYQVADYSRELPAQNFDVIVSALSIHHLENRDKEALFERIYDKLPEGGLFVNYDQFCAGQPDMDSWFDSYWESQLADSGLTEHDIALWKERRKLDKECSVEEETAMLGKRGFKSVKCVYSYQKFSVIVAIK
ncbi:MAG: class I SAM-dependent methyltransferase [Lachnospiraceae bacterium]|nr:class I SAM-dependent methyltransferase [Lachnospiraceae bacterium]